MNSNEYKNGLLLAIGVMLVVTAGCRNRSNYAPRPLVQSEIDVQLASYRSETVADGNDVNAVPAYTEQEIVPEQAAQFAILNHPALQTIRADRGIAEAQIIQAGILPNPQVNASFDTPAFGATSGALTADSQSLAWDITSLRPRNAKISSAAANAASVDMDILWQEWQFGQAARQAAYDLAALEKQLYALKEGQRVLDENLKVVRKAFDERNLTIVESSAAESASIVARNNTLALEQEVRQQRVVLNRAMGHAAGTEVQVSLSVEFPEKIELPPDEKLIQMVQYRPDLDAVRNSYASQEDALRAAVAAQIPTTNFNLTRASDTSNVGTLGAGVTVDLQLFDRNHGNIANETATRNKIQRQYSEKVFTARAEVAAALTDIRTLQSQVDSARQAIPVLEKLVESYDKSVKDKNSNVLVYYLA